MKVSQFRAEEEAIEAVRRLVPGYAGAPSHERPAVQVGNFLSAKDQPVEEAQLSDETITSTTNNPFIGGPETVWVCLVLESFSFFIELRGTVFGVACVTKTCSRQRRRL